MNTLDCLIYVSTSKLPPTDSTGGIDDIVSISALRNHEARITGILTTQEGRFIQMLEGAPAALDLLMLHLHFDSRHEDINVVARERILARDVVSWSMVSPPPKANPDPEISRLLALLPNAVAPWREALLKLIGEPPRPSMMVQAA